MTSKDSPAVYLLLSGFPDQPTTFNSFAKPFEDKYHVVKMCFPDMDQDSLSNFWGYSVPDLELALVEVIQEYRVKYKCNTIYLHGFDWGAAVTLQVAQHYPHLITKLVQQDIGILIPTQVSLYTGIVILGYQLFLANAFLLSRCFCNDKLAGTVLGPLVRNCFPWSLVMPVWPADVFRNFQPHKMYPYFRTICDALLGKINMKFAKTVPQFYAYGTQKNIMFHSEYYLHKLETTRGCRHKAYNGGHWFHHDCQDEFRRDVQAFFDS